MSLPELPIKPDGFIVYSKNISEAVRLSANDMHSYKKKKTEWVA